ncbi:MAG: T9SS type A sorting domain-containing protein [Reichenbachiella sp.]
MKYLLALFVGISFSLNVIGACPSPGDITNPFAIATYTITVGDSPCNITLDDGDNIFSNIIIETGATFNITTDGTITLTTWFGNGGSLTTESGGTFNVIDENGDNTGGNFLLGGLADLDIQDGAFANIDGDFDLGGVFTGDATIDGDLAIGGDLNINGNGTLEGDGELDVTGDIVDNGGDTGDWTGDVSCDGGTCDSLPVELISFYQEIDLNNTVSLYWSTASEINNEGFEIEKSLDGEYFETIGYVTGNGTTNEIQQYEFVDNYCDETSYYRLKQIDFDGQFEYSSIIKATRVNTETVQLYPSTVSNKLSLVGNSKTEFTYQVFDISGQLHLSSSVLQNLENLSIEIENNLNQLKPSVYILKLYSTDIQHSIRFIKQ